MLFSIIVLVMATWQRSRSFAWKPHKAGAGVTPAPAPGEAALSLGRASAVRLEQPMPF